MFRTIIVLIALLTCLPVAAWISGDPRNRMELPFARLVFSWVVWSVIAGAAAALLLWARSRWRSDARAGSGSGGGGRWGRGSLLALLASTVILYTVVSFTTFDGKPLHQDSMTQAFQAHVFADGHLSAPAPEMPEFFSSLLIAESNGRSFSQFPPGWAALLAVGLWLGIPWLLPPLFGGLAALGLYTYLRESGASQGVALATTALFALSPWVVFNAASWMNHIPALALILLGSAALVRAVRGPHSARPAFVAGLLLGVSASVRPLEAVAFGLPAWIWLFANALRRPQERTTMLWFVVGGSIPAGLLIVYNVVVLGGPFDFGYSVLWGSAHGLGFHEAPWGPPHTPFRGLQFLNNYLRNMQAAFFEYPAPVLLPAFLGLFFARRLEPEDRYLLSSVGLLFLGYFLYWHEGDYLGPRFLLPAAPIAAIWMVRLGPVLVQRGQSIETRKWLHTMIAVMLVVGWWVGGRRAMREYADSYPSRRLDLSTLASPALDRAIILVPTTWEASVATRLWATGLPRVEAQWFFDRVPLCQLDVALSDLEATPGATRVEVERRLLPLTADSTLLKGERFSGVPINPLLGFGDDAGAIPPQCVQRSRAQQERVSLSLLPFLAAFGPTWTGDGPIIAQDMDELNPALLALFPYRTVYLLRVARAADGSPAIRLVPRDTPSPPTSGETG